jgi:hypothetical protein
VSNARYSITLIFLLTTLIGCAHVPTSTPTMSGDWLLQLNSGEEFPVSINQVDPSNIFINADEVQISGRYGLTSNNLTLLDANQSRISEVEFIGKNDGSWVMVKAPLAARIGYQLGGSSLTKMEN